MYNKRRSNLELEWERRESFVCVCLFRVALVASGGSQARGWIRDVAAGLCHGHSHARSELHLQSIHSSWQRLILNPLIEARDRTWKPHGSYSDSFPLCHNGNSLNKRVNFKGTLENKVCKNSQAKRYFFLLVWRGLQIKFWNKNDIARRVFGQN